MSDSFMHTLLTRCIPQSPRIARAGWVGLLFLSLLGCQAFTREAGLQELRKREEAQRAEERKSENEARTKKIEEESAVAAQKNALIEKRQELNKKRVEATEALAAGDAAKAHLLLTEVLSALKENTAGDGVPPPEGAASASDPRLAAAEKALFDAKETAKTYAMDGHAVFQLGKKEEALAALRKAIELDGEYSHGRRTLGKMLLMMERPQEALDVYKPELEKGMRDADLLFPVAQALFVQGQKENDSGKIEAARVALQSVLVERPTDPEVRRWLARLEYDTGRFEEAARFFESIRKESPLDPQYLEYLANCYVKLKEYQKAADYLELSARVTRPSADACRMLGEIYSVLALPGRAAEWQARASGGDPKRATPEDCLSVGLLFLEAGRSTDAVKWLEGIPEGEKSFAEAQSTLAYLYHDLGRSVDALRAFENLSRARPQDGHAFLSAGDIYRERKEQEKAAEAYARASALPETRADGFAGLAELAYDRGDLEQAARQYQKAAESNPRETRFGVLLHQVKEEIQFRRASDSSTTHAGGN